jgi:hypothetical protein
VPVLLSDAPTYPAARVRPVRAAVAGDINPNAARRIQTALNDMSPQGRRTLSTCSGIPYDDPPDNQRNALPAHTDHRLKMSMSAAAESGRKVP